MSAIIKILFDICLLRKGPEDLPSSFNLMFVLIVVSLLVSIVLGLAIYNYQLAVILSIVGLFVTFVFVKILLINKAERFIQTFSAMLGTSVLIDVISIPILYPLLGEKLDKNLAVLFWLLSIAVYGWFVVIYGFIVSRAISSTLGYGISIAIGYALVSYMIFDLILSGRAST
ncbi:MAG: hypothetical protein P8X88_07805 [Gammaproteobacteria bacterium]